MTAIEHLRKCSEAIHAEIDGLLAAAKKVDELIFDLEPVSKKDDPPIAFKGREKEREIDADFPKPAENVEMEISKLRNDGQTWVYIARETGLTVSACQATFKRSQSHDRSVAKLMAGT